MKIKITFSSPHDDDESKVYDDLATFLKQHPMFKGILSQGRDHFDQEIIISVPDYPLEITVDYQTKG